MQINGIGNSSTHSNAHNVTTCIQNHQSQTNELKGNMGVAVSSNSASTQHPPRAPQQSEESFSLSAWLQNTFLSAKKLWGKIWGSETEMVQKDMVSETNNGILHTGQIEVASAAVQPAQNFNNNPYFSTITEETLPKQTIWQKIKVRFQNITGFLAKRFSFSNGSSFQTKQERQKEDLRRHSRYRKGDVEMDCIITDDSFLMDSYNKKGEYRKISTREQSAIDIDM